jgi:GNAT superfamily N-acetyltransferase
MQSLYAKYLSERSNDLIIESHDSFASYRYVDDKNVYIVDIFVDPESRRAGEASRLADAICKEAKDRGCIYLLGSVVPSAKNSTKSMRVLLGYGMSLHSASNDFVIFRKDL